MGCCLVLVVRLGMEDGSARDGGFIGVLAALGVVSVRLRDFSCFSGPGVSSAEVYGVGAVGMDDNESVRFKVGSLLTPDSANRRGEGGGVGSLFFFLPESRRTSRLMPLGLRGDGGASIALFRSSSDSFPNKSSSGGPFFLEGTACSTGSGCGWSMSTDEVLGPR